MILARLTIRTRPANFRGGVWACLFAALAIYLVYAPSTGLIAGQSEDRQLLQHRNRGNGYFENEEFQSALVEYGECIKLAPNSAGDWANLGLAYYKAGNFDSAVTAAEGAGRLDEKVLQSYYTLGLIYKKLNKFSEAVGQFEKVLQFDPADDAAYYQLGLMYKKLGQGDDAMEAFRATVRHRPNHPSAHYYLFMYAKEAGRQDEARRELRVFNDLQKQIPDKQRTETAFEQGPYLKPVIVPQQAFLPAEDDIRKKILFVNVTETAGLAGLGQPLAGSRVQTMAATDYRPSYLDENVLPQWAGALKLVDIDLDGDLDAFLVRFGGETRSSPNLMFMNNGHGRFRPDSARTGAAAGRGDMKAAMGDFNNDGIPDVCLLGTSHYSLFQTDLAGRLVDVSASAGIAAPSVSAMPSDGAFVDYDHDGDLDLLVANYCEFPRAIVGDSITIPDGLPPSGNILYRNNGNGSFVRVDDSLWTDSESANTVAIMFGDYDDDDDTDILFVNEDGPSQLCLNIRSGRLQVQHLFDFPGATAGASGDVDNDGHLDVVLAGGGSVVFFKNDGKAAFSPHTLIAPSEWLAGQRVGNLTLFDFDNDGLLDLLAALEDGRLGPFANDGSGLFTVFSEDMLAAESVRASVIDLEPGDIDNDGDIDVLGLWSGGVPFVLENRGGESSHWLNVEPVGVRVNRQGVGARIEVKTGPYYQRRETTGWPVHFGLGGIDHVDVLRITWTNGIVQNVIGPQIDRTLRVEEIVRTDASCPFLFAFDGERFTYVNDILGVAAMGVPLGAGVYHTPDPDEYVKIDGSLLRASDGTYQLRLPEELKEVTYLDETRLIVIDHPIEAAVFPNERFSEPPFIEPGIHTVRYKHHPIAAIDDHGHDVLRLINREDLTYPSDFEMTAYDGLAEPHWIDCDLGDLSGSNRITLYLTGWIYWSSASANVAVSQDTQQTFEVVSLSVPDKAGRWVVVIEDIGLPNGKNSTLPVDLTGKFPSNDYRVRISTNMVIYWDELFFTVDEPAVEIRQQEARLIEADLHYRGFSAMRRDSTGLEFFDYDDVHRHGPWRQHAGKYTRYGAVTDLLLTADDRYVVYGPGEEVALTFDASDLLPVPADWARDFFFYAYGWIKDGDPNTRFSETVTPLPFRSMPGYPYSDSLKGKADEIAEALAAYLIRPQVETVESLR
ncbi:MAG TPA: FG-GAP-like repeat-containing protein [Candidatus Deferrimicrobium sp.]|nr:FG-GAP-like repeat-containing protein [Candidatus Deferrimicrobium sp.]